MTKQYTSNIIYTAIGSALILSMTACVGGGSGGSEASTGTTPSTSSGSTSSTTPSSNATGVFIDAPVQGLRVERSSGSTGTTGSFGEFQYTTGETVTFYLGALKLGSVVAKAEITPLDLFNTIDIDNRKVLNLLRLLQSLDSDSNLSNGIQLNSQMIQSASDSMSKLSLDQDTTAFQNTADVSTVLSKKRQGLTLTSVTEAKSHFDSTRQTAKGVGLFTGSFTFGGKTQSTSGIGGANGVYNGSYIGADNKKYTLLLQRTGTSTGLMQISTVTQQVIGTKTVSIPDIKEEDGALTISATEIRFTGKAGSSFVAAKVGAAALMGANALFGETGKGITSVCSNGIIFVDVPIGYGLNPAKYVGLAYPSASGLQYVIKPIISIGEDITTTGALSVSGSMIEFSLPNGKLSIQKSAAGNTSTAIACS